MLSKLFLDLVGEVVELIIQNDEIILESWWASVNIKIDFTKYYLFDCSTLLVLLYKASIFNILNQALPIFVNYYHQLKKN